MLILWAFQGGERPWRSVRFDAPVHYGTAVWLWWGRCTSWVPSIGVPQRDYYRRHGLKCKSNGPAAEAKYDEVSAPLHVHQGRDYRWRPNSATARMVLLET